MKMINPQTEEDKNLLKIGKYIQYLRKTRTGLSAEKFANKKDFDRVQYSRIENGANITMKTLLKVIASHHMTLEDFLFDFIQKNRNYSKK